MKTIDQLLADVPALGSLAAEHRDTIAGCARNQTIGDGEYAFREGDRADSFYVLRSGTVALEIYAPRGGAVTIETVHDGDMLGWSWLFEPYRYQFDARSIGTTHLIEFDAACLRGKLDQDPALGYDLLKLFAAVIVERLQETRVRLLDVYGNVPGGSGSR